MSLLFTVAAHAWNLEEAVWPVEEGPVPYCVDTTAPHGFAAGVPEEAAARAVAMWEAEGVDFEVLSVCPSEPAGHLRFEFADDGTFLSTELTPEVGVVGEVVRGACTYTRRDSAVIHVGQGSELLALPEEVAGPPRARTSSASSRTPSGTRSGSGTPVRRRSRVSIRRSSRH